MQFRNGIFVITEETNCPLYNTAEEMTVSEGILTLIAGKQTCLIMAAELMKIVSEDGTYETYSDGKNQKVKFECGGCSGLIRFEYKRAKEFSTLQMKLLAATERKEKIKHTAEYADLLRSIEIFSTLSEDDLLDLAVLLEFLDYPWQFPIAQKGDPGNRLFILLAGRAEVIDEKGVVIAELHKGEVFGEMSLLSGERVSTTIMAAEPSKVAVMNQKDFRHVLNRFPTLQVFFYKLLVSRITKMNEQRAEELSSGMVGQLADLAPVELCQMINSNHKTGRLNIEFDDRYAVLLFNEGELVYADYNGQEGRDAFYNILSIEEGRFKFTQGLSREQKKFGVLGGFMGMLMEGMKRLDDLH